jgi:hypothetical protein
VFKVFVSVCVVVCCSRINSARACRTVRSPACNELLTVKKSRPRRDHPLEWEVLYLRRCLLFFVPVELVNLIIEHAQYWPRSFLFLEHKPDFTLSVKRDSANNNPHRIYFLCRVVDLEGRDRVRQEFGEKLLGKSKKKWNGLKFSRKEEVSNLAAEKEESKVIRKVKKVVFKIWSHDQGPGAEPNEPHLTGPKIML